MVFPLRANRLGSLPHARVAAPRANFDYVLMGMQLEMSSAMEVMQAQQDGMAQQIRQLQEQIQAVLKARDVAVWL